MSIESPGSNESWVERLREVGSTAQGKEEEKRRVRRDLGFDESEDVDSRDNNDSSRSSESIELGKKLVDGLLGVSLRMTEEGRPSANAFGKTEERREEKNEPDPSHSSSLQRNPARR